MSFKRNLRNLKSAFHKNFWWFVFAACLAALLFYGFHGFTAQPAVETITTQAPTFNSNNNQMREVDFHTPKRAGRR